jgi:isopropylmalate/homocitrate/citramalate synthase
VGSRLTRRITSLGLQASAGVNLLTLVNDDHLERYCTAMAQAGVRQIWLSDGPSGLSPEAWAHVVTLVRRFAPDCEIGIYTRNTFGLALANLLECVHAGAHIVEASVNGIAAGAGLADMAQVAAALEILYGVDTGIDLTRLTSLARLVEDVSGVPLAAGHPITGRNAHDWGGTEISVQELKVEPLLHWAFEPSLVGGRKEWSLSVTSGMWTLADKLDELGLRVAHGDMPETLARILSEIAIRGRSLTDDEIADTVRRPR